MSHVLTACKPCEPLHTSQDGIFSLQYQQILPGAADADLLNPQYRFQNHDLELYHGQESRPQEAIPPAWQASSSLDYMNTESDIGPFPNDFHIDEQGGSLSNEANAQYSVPWHDGAGSRDQALLSDIPRAIHLPVADDSQQWFTTTMEPEKALPDAQTPYTLKERKRRRLLERLSVSQTHKDLFGHPAARNGQHPPTEVTSAFPNFNGRAHAGPPLVQREVMPEADAMSDLASAQCSSIEMRSPPPSRGEGLGAASGQGMTGMLHEDRRPVTWPIRSARRSWNMSVKALGKVVDQLNVF